VWLLPEFSFFLFFPVLQVVMQDAKYQTTAKHYPERREVAKQMIKKGFRIFDGTPVSTPIKKKDFTSL
jgi:hypothetical protein